MKRVLIDSDVVIAAIAQGEKQTPDRLAVMRGLTHRKFIGMTTPVIMANVQHILGRKWEVKKNKPDRARVVEAMTIVLPLFTMIPVDTSDFYASMASSFVDLEDGIQHFAALRSAKVDLIVSCNYRDFPQGAISLPVHSPLDFATEYL